MQLFYFFCTKIYKINKNIMNKTYYKIENLYDNVRVISCRDHSCYCYIKLDSLCPLHNCTFVLANCTYRPDRKTVFIALGDFFEVHFEHFM